MRGAARRDRKKLSHRTGRQRAIEEGHKWSRGAGKRRGVVKEEKGSKEGREGE